MRTGWNGGPVQLICRGGLLRSTLQALVAMFGNLKKEKWQRCEVMDTYSDLVVVTISQCIQVSGHQFVNLKFIQFFIVNYPSELRKNKGASGKFFLVWILVL